MVVKKQHYVPRVYLKAFSTDDMVYQYDIKRNLFRYANIMEVAYEKYFYDIRAKEINKLLETDDISNTKLNQSNIISNQEIEKFYSEVVEGKLYQSIRQIISFYNDNNSNFKNIRNKRFDTTVISDLAYYVAAQEMRTKSTREMISRNIEQFNEFVDSIKQSTEIPFEESIEREHRYWKNNASDHYKRTVHLGMLANLEHLEGMSNIYFYGYKWIILVAPQHSEFITSDHPTVFNQRFDFDGKSLYFPIHPMLCIELIDIRSEKAKNSKEGCYVHISPQEVAKINILIFNSAHESVFFRNKNIFRAQLTIFHILYKTLDSILNAPVEDWLSKYRRR